MISLNSVNKVVKKGNTLTHMLRGVTLSIEAKECFGILGRAGSGLSHLLRVMNLLDLPTHGSITIEQTDFTNLSQDDLRLARRSMGVVFQQLNLLESRTVFENVALPLEFIGRKDMQIDVMIRPILSHLHLADKVDCYPSELTHFQKILVALARALATQPRILLCEEITTGLDTKTKQQLLQILKSIHQHYPITLVFFSHDVDAIKSLCQRVAVLHQGEVVEQGNILDIYTRPQNPITKELIKQAARFEIPSVLRNQLQGKSTQNDKTIVRISFEDPATQESFISYVAQNFHIHMSIIQAHMETLGDKKVGIMIIELLGEPDEVKKALGFLNRKNIHVEVLGYVP